LAPRTPRGEKRGRRRSVNEQLSSARWLSKTPNNPPRGLEGLESFGEKKHLLEGGRGREPAGGKSI